MVFIEIVFAIYFIFMFWLIQHWSQLTLFDQVNSNRKLPVKFTILIPFRNEAENIKSCINSLSNLNYSNSFFEVIFLNDHSDDGGEKIVAEFIDQNPHFSLQNLTKESGKKSAIQFGIKKGNNPWIITLDADCRVHENWLTVLSDYIINNDKKYIVMPVVFDEEFSVFEKIQSLELLTLVATSAACIQGEAPLMSNGANVAFTKEIFNEVNGFEGNGNISSGDDLFLLHKINSIQPKSIGYIHHPEVIVSTKACVTLSEFVQQRIRWGSKSKAYKSNFARFITLLIVTINLTLLVCFLLALFQQISWFLIASIFLLKLAPDWIFIRKLTPFYGKQKLSKYSFLLAICYPFYIFVISIASFIYQPQWKGRKISTKA